MVARKLIAGGLLGAAAASDEAEAGFLPATMKGILGASKISPKANRKNLLAARTMLEEGVQPRIVYEQTGYFRGADGKMRFETPDPENIDFEAAEGATRLAQLPGDGLLGDGGYTRQVDLTGAIDQYPAADLMFPTGRPSVRTEQMDNYRGYYDPHFDAVALNESLSDKELSSTLAHELQHGVQRRNELAPGANPDSIKQQIDRGLLSAQQPFRKADLSYDLSRDKIKNLSRIAAASKYRKYSLDSNLTGKRRLLVGNSDWYEFGDKIRQELGPEPKRHRSKAEREQWLGAAWAKLANFVDPLDDAAYAQLYDMSKTPRGAVGDYVGDGVGYLLKNDGSYPIGISERAALGKELLQADPKLADKQIKRISSYLDSIRDDAVEFSRLRTLRAELGDERDYELYKRSAGEVEARNVQNRLGMTQDERYDSYPPDTEDVPRNEQILNQNPSQAAQRGAANPAALAATAATGAGILGAGQVENGVDKIAGIADAAANAAAGMVAPILSAPGAVARYLGDRYVPGVDFSAEDIARERQNTEQFFDYQPRTELGQQYSDQGMQALGGLLAPVVDASQGSNIIDLLKSGYNKMGKKEKELTKALLDMSPI
ncbi:MAG: LPD23 domain-containing protein [Lentimonas sp.]